MIELSPRESVEWAAWVMLLGNLLIFGSSRLLFRKAKAENLRSALRSLLPRSLRGSREPDSARLTLTRVSVVVMLLGYVVALFGAWMLFSNAGTARDLLNQVP